MGLGIANRPAHKTIIPPLAARCTTPPQQETTVIEEGKPLPHPSSLDEGVVNVAIALGGE